MPFSIPCAVQKAVAAFTECDLSTPLTERLRAYEVATDWLRDHRDDPDAPLLTWYVTSRSANIVTGLSGIVPADIAQANRRIAYLEWRVSH